MDTIKVFLKMRTIPPAKDVGTTAMVVRPKCARYENLGITCLLR